MTKAVKNNTLINNTLTIECDKCGCMLGYAGTFGVKLEYVLCFTPEKSRVLVTYFDCPECGKRYMTFASDEKSRAYRSQLDLIEKKQKNARNKGNVSYLKHLQKKHDEIYKEYDKYSKWLIGVIKSGDLALTVAKLNQG